MKTNLFLTGIVPAIFLFACSNGNSPSTDQASTDNVFIKSVHNGCGRLQKTNSDSYLADHYYDKDTLVLVIGFTANCCPAFVDSVDVSAGSIKIFVQDTLAGCHCLCPYTDDFKFLYSYEDKTLLEFWQAGKSGIYNLGFETSF